MANGNLDRVRGNVLDRIERAEQFSRGAILAAAVLEAAFLIALFVLADFKDRTHFLIVLAAIAVYTLLALGLIALGAHVSRCTERVLRAIELTRPGGGSA